jgi:hypothetical protein
MSKIIEALEFLKTDLEKAKEQWRSGKQFESLLQREQKDLNQLLDKFDPKPDENDWSSEYGSKKRRRKLSLYRRRIAFLAASRKEFREEYGDEVTDVDFMRLLELPYTDPKFAIEYSIEELQDKS